MIIYNEDGRPWPTQHGATREAMLRHGATFMPHFVIKVPGGYAMDGFGVPTFFEHLPEDIRAMATEKLLEVEAMFMELDKRRVETRGFWNMGPHYAKEIRSVMQGIKTWAYDYFERLARFKAGDIRVKQHALDRALQLLKDYASTDLSDPKFHPIDLDALPDGESGVRPKDRGGRKFTHKQQLDGATVWLEWNIYTNDPAYWQAEFKQVSAISSTDPNEAVAKAKEDWERHERTRIFRTTNEFTREELKALGGKPATNRRLIRELARFRMIQGWRTARINALINDILASQTIWLKVKSQTATPAA